MSSKMEVVYQDLNDNEIILSPAVVKKYICNNPAITDSEMAMFLKLCQHQKLNPFLREVYLVKYGSAPASMITGKETFLKRAKRDIRYQGHKCTIEGKVPDMTATAEVFVKDYQTPITCTVWYEEYVGRKKDGSPTGMWANKPRTMLQKVALVQALREAFPDTFGGMYSQEEINTIDADKLPTANIIIEDTEPEKPEAEDNEVMEKAMNVSSKNRAVENVKEVFDAKVVEVTEAKLERLGVGGKDSPIADKPEVCYNDEGFAVEEYVDYLISLFKCRIEENLDVNHLEDYLELPCFQWTEAEVHRLERLGAQIVSEEITFDSVFGTYFAD
jgi:phage recombination protein Bet